VKGKEESYLDHHNRNIYDRAFSRSISHLLVWCRPSVPPQTFLLGLCLGYRCLPILSRVWVSPGQHGRPTNPHQNRGNAPVLSPPRGQRGRSWVDGFRTLRNLQWVHRFGLYPSAGREVVHLCVVGRCLYSANCAFCAAQPLSGVSKNCWCAVLPFSLPVLTYVYIGIVALEIWKIPSPTTRSVEGQQYIVNRPTSDFVSALSVFFWVEWAQNSGALRIVFMSCFFLWK